MIGQTLRHYQILEKIRKGALASCTVPRTPS